MAVGAAVVGATPVRVKQWSGWNSTRSWNQPRGEKRNERGIELNFQAETLEEAPTCQALAPWPLNAYCSAFRSSQLTRAFSASIFSQVASIAMANTMNEFVTAICRNEA
jgi:hypothetical protein